jgi:hypothetical protein
MEKFKFETEKVDFEVSLIVPVFQKWLLRNGNVQREPKVKEVSFLFSDFDD